MMECLGSNDLSVTKARWNEMAALGQSRRAGAVSPIYYCDLVTQARGFSCSA